MATPIELARLAAAVAILRPDWPTKSLQTYLETHHAGRPHHDLTVALAWIATDPKTKTPARLAEAGPWWTCLNTGAATGTSHPVDCEHHGSGYRRADGQLSCCWADRGDNPDPMPPRPPSTPPAEAQAIAAQLAPRGETPATRTGRDIDPERLEQARRELDELHARTAVAANVPVETNPGVEEGGLNG